MRVFTLVMLVVVMVVVVLVMVEGSSVRRGVNADLLTKGIQLVNNGYDGILVKVDDRLPETWCSNVLLGLEVSVGAGLGDLILVEAAKHSVFPVGA